MNTHIAPAAPLHTTPTRYSTLSSLMHWAVALLILGSFPLGLYMVELSFSPAKLKYYAWHKWAGVTVFGLALLRLLWRRVQPPPPPLPGQPRWQLAAAHVTHVALYALLVAVPLSGWLYSSAAGFPTVYLGIWQLPDLVPKDGTLKEIFDDVHEVLTWTLAGLVALHAAAALKHGLIDRDGTLARMLPWGRRG